MHVYSLLTMPVIVVPFVLSSHSAFSSPRHPTLSPQRQRPESMQSPASPTLSFSSFSPSVSPRAVSPRLPVSPRRPHSPHQTTTSPSQGAHRSISPLRRPASPALSRCRPVSPRSPVLSLRLMKSCATKGRFREHVLQFSSILDESTKLKRFDWSSLADEFICLLNSFDSYSQSQSSNGNLGVALSFPPC